MSFSHCHVDLQFSVTTKIKPHFQASTASKLEELTSMTKDGSKRIKELEKDKKSLEQKFSQAEKVFFWC